MNLPFARLIAIVLAAGSALAAAPAIAAAETGTPPGLQTLQIGDRAPDFSLPGVDGRTYTLADFKEARCLMVIFLSNHCPVSHAAEARLIPFVESMRGRGLAVVAINPNSDDGTQIDELGYSKYGENFEGAKAYARDAGFNFPTLYDGDTQTVAQAYGCLTTPHVFIFDRAGRLAYKGRYDDSDLVDPATVHSPDAVNAIKAILAGEPVAVPSTRPVGCSTKWKGLKGVVEKFDREMDSLPVTVAPITDAEIAALAANPTNRLRVINLWATWCVPCVQEFPGLVMTARRLARRDFDFISISLDNPKDAAKVKQFLEQNHAATLPVGMVSVRQEGRQTNHYQYNGAGSEALARALDQRWEGPMPYTIVIAPGGEIIFRRNGPVDPHELQDYLIDRLGKYRLRSRL